MALVNFKKGTLAGLAAATKAEGTFYVTTDEHALYLDISGSERIRLGDFQEFENLEALKANSNPSTTALYYVKDINCLAKYNGTGYVQINPDTGATKVAKSGEGNAIADISYDESTRTLTLTMTTLPTTENVNAAINAKVGNIGDSATVAEYVNAKTSGIASDEALTELEERVETAESDIDALEAKVGNDTVAKQISDAITNLDLGNTYAAKSHEHEIDDVDGLQDALDEKADASDVSSTYETKTDATSKKEALEAEIAKKQDALAFQTEYDKSTNKVATMADVTSAVAGLSGAMHWKGELDEVPEDDEGGTYAAGDVVTVDGVEYAFDGEAWIELGNEASHHTHNNLSTLEKITESTLTDIATTKEKAAANETAITNIKDGVELESFGDVEDELDGIQEVLDGLDEAYDEKGAADAVKTELIGESGDAKTEDTINGAKNFATDAVNTAKTALIGETSAGKDTDTINGAKAFATDAVNTALTWGSF